MMTYEEFVSTVAAGLRKRGPELEAYVGQIGNFDKVQERIVTRLINLESNREFLKDIPHIKIHDLAVVFYLLIRADEDEQMTTVISNTLLEYWRISVKELKAVAWKNSQKLMPSVFVPLERLFGESLPLYVLSHQHGLYGAVAMLYPGMLKEAAEEIGSDLVVLPSSVNEVLLLPYEEGISLHDLRHLVQFVNRTEVPEEERLSDNVYVYRQAEDTLEMDGRIVHLGEECIDFAA